ncbi:hypothetical protein Bpfe_010356 [Biomphalaria pfeifferi]|uniref:RanBP2-type domain-containing protein n=1 Tax=Biomphalaria pfeifferi TaxID=112525 RepID=A0AAD8FEE7_BIOPF|nr:hypothetical protein Bpfe_010356 [Biomphalaria pfeifferi]
MLTLTYIIITFVFSTRVASFPSNEEEDLSLETQADDTVWRSKRINQVACHCCSNSFNSNCCYKCMKSMGKRSVSVPDDQQPVVSQEVSKEVLDLDFNDKEVREDVDYCLCCVLEKEVDSSVSSSTCCKLCGHKTFRIFQNRIHL